LIARLIGSGKLAFPSHADVLGIFMDGLASGDIPLQEVARFRAALDRLAGDPGVPANPGWVRWAGGFVLGIALGPWLASEGWVKEQPFIAGLAAGYTLSCLALLYSVVSGEYGGAAWFIWMPIVILGMLAPIMWRLAIK
jgi:hypothetical protein